MTGRDSFITISEGHCLGFAHTKTLKFPTFFFIFWVFPRRYRQFVSFKENIKIETSFSEASTSVWLLWLPLPCGNSKNISCASEAELHSCLLQTHNAQWPTKHLKVCAHLPILLTEMPANCKRSPSGRKMWRENTWCSFEPRTVSGVLRVTQSRVVPQRCSAQQRWNHSVSNTLNDFPTSHLPHLLLSVHLDLFEPLCLRWHQLHCSITASSTAMEQCQVSLKLSFLQTKITQVRISVRFCCLSLPPKSAQAAAWSQHWTLK